MPIKNTLATARTRTVEFARRHKTALTITGTAAVTTVAVSQIQKGALKEAYDFIDDYGLTDNFMDSIPFSETI